MNLFPYILGPVWVLDATLTPDGHTIAVWRCKMGCEPQQTVYDAAAVAKGVAVVTVSGHGTIVKPADSQLAARVRDDRATFLWSEHDGRIAFVRRERLQGVLAELSEAGIIRSGSRSPRRPMLRPGSFSQDSAGGSCSTRRPRVRRWRRPSCGGRHCRCWDFFFACWQPMPPSPRR